MGALRAISHSPRAMPSNRRFNDGRSYACRCNVCARGRREAASHSDAAGTQVEIFVVVDEILVETTGPPRKTRA